MNTLQAWMIVGVPVLVTAMGLLAGRSKRRAWAAMALLVALVVFFLTVPGDVISASLLGLLLVAAVATGRGTHTDDEFREQHEDRKRLTVARQGGQDAP